MVSPIPIEQLYMLLGVKEAEIYSLKDQLERITELFNQNQLRLQVYAANENRNQTDDRFGSERKSDSRLAHFPESIKPTGAAFGLIPETERTTEGLRQPSGTTQDNVGIGRDREIRDPSGS